MGSGESSLRRSTCTSDRPPYPAPADTTNTAAACLPRGSPPASWPAASASTSRRASAVAGSPASHEASMAATTSGPASMFPWMA